MNEDNTTPEIDNDSAGIINGADMDGIGRNDQSLTGATAGEVTQPQTGEAGEPAENASIGPEPEDIALGDSSQTDSFGGDDAARAAQDIDGHAGSDDAHTR